MRVPELLADPRFLWDRKPPPALEEYDAFCRTLPAAVPASYREFMKLCNGGSGDIKLGSGFLWLWSVQEQASNNDGYGFSRWMPGFTGFGGDGTDVLFCFDLREPNRAPIFAVSAVCMTAEDAWFIASDWNELLFSAYA